MPRRKTLKREAKLKCRQTQFLNKIEGYLKAQVLYRTFFLFDKELEQQIAKIDKE